MKEWVKKLWGKTRELSRTERSGVHLIEIEPFGFCSEHKHNNLSNEFYVIDGQLQIVIYYDSGISECIILSPGQSFKVEKGFWHRFINGNQKTICLELYECTPHDSNDIERRDEGGPNHLETHVNLLKSVKNCCCPPCSNNTEYCCNGN